MKNVERPQQLYKGINPAPDVFFKGRAVVLEYRFRRRRGKDQEEKISHIKMTDPTEPKARSHNASRPVKIIFTGEDMMRYKELKAELEGFK